MSNLIASFKNKPKNNLLGNTPTYKNVSIVRTAQEAQKNELEKKYDKKLIFQSVIGPISSENKEKKEIFNARHNKLVDEFKNNLQELQKFRNNLPYKAVLSHFLKEEDYLKIKKKEDILIHKTTKLEKLEDLDKLEKELKEFNDLLEKHKNELKIIYSMSKKGEYAKKFAYNKLSKQKVKYDPLDFNETKKEKLDILKKEQEELEANTKELDEILNSMKKLEKNEREKYKKRQKKISSI